MFKKIVHDDWNVKNIGEKKVSLVYDGSQLYH